VCSWARAIRRPSDLGFDDARFVLPELREVEHIVEVNELAASETLLLLVFTQHTTSRPVKVGQYLLNLHL
jgi:hypothetical protein